MSTMAREQEIEEVLNHLKDVNVKTITLWGKEGVGKTWTARSVMHRAIKENLFDNDSIIWITVGRGCGGLRLIWKIAQELSFVTDSADYDNDEEESMESMVERISASLMGKRFFLILDDIDWSSQNFFDELGIPYPDGQNGSKILITRSDISVDIIDRQNDSNTSGLKTAIDGDVSLHLNSLSEEDALKLFHEKKCIKVSQHINILVQHVVEKCEHLPLVIVVIAGALKDINDSSALKDALDIAVNSGNSNSYLQLLQFGYNMLPSDSIRNCFLYFATLTSEVCDIHYNELVTYWIMEGLIDEFGQIEETYEKGHAVLRELIDRGMIQQRDDHVSMHYLIRKMALHIIDKYHCKIFAKAGFGLTEPLKNGIWRSFKKITLMDYVINAYNSRSKIYNPCALLLEGDRNGLLREIPKAFFLHMQRLQFLALLQVKTKLLPSSLSGLEQLHVLLLRKCDSLKDVSTIQGLRKLVVLDFSGCKALKEIPDGFFDDMHYLQVLDLSETSLKQLPPSLSNLTGLRQLFLKGCLYLEKLPSLEALRKLKVFDLSDAASIKEVGNDNSFNYMSHLQVLNLSGTAIEFLPELCNLKNLYQLLLANCSRLRQFPQIKALEKLEVLDVSDASTLSEVPTLDCLPNLKVLNFSGTSIQQLPFFHNDSMLHQLLLRGCTCLKSLQHPRVLVKLELLDLTDTKISNGIQDESFWFMPNLQILYLSKSFVKELPSFLNLMNLRQLFLTKCSSLTTIPPSEKLTRLEVLDLSGAKALRIIDEKYFDHMISLQILKLSGSQIGKLPSLSMLRNLTELLLSGCPLRNLPDLKELTKLEKLDLSHNSALTELQKQSFQHLHQLRILNLSYTLLESVPDLKALTKLEQLDLSHNSALMELQEESFQNLHQLRILNLSYTLLESLPSISELTNLQKLLLKCCSRLVGLPSLRKLSKLEVLDLSGTKIVKFPYETSELTCLKQLDLLCLEELGDVDWGEITWLPEVVNWDYNISNTPTGWPDILSIGGDDVPIDFTCIIGHDIIMLYLGNNHDRCDVVCSDLLGELKFVSIRGYP
ncbi:PREDICTED: putative disease resistance protein At4g19050 isoform X2 [Nelumbo nucifera]|uniref:Disease resistance protein At4g19050 isoform X2 n=1 Tax=Nelumbo nucifera TaxID=4432 RepID=A0A1U8A9E3_NELNU|nr:PREDICTED: putative disease resistance protein At4g19050 isoform X2 [Nelumbo nucifera]